MFTQITDVSTFRQLRDGDKFPQLTSNFVTSLAAMVRFGEWHTRLSASLESFCRIPTNTHCVSCTAFHARQSTYDLNRARVEDHIQPLGSFSTQSLAQANIQVQDKSQRHGSSTGTQISRLETWRELHRFRRQACPPRSRLTNFFAWCTF